MEVASVEVSSAGENLNGSSISESDLLSLVGRCPAFKPALSSTVSLESDERGSFDSSKPSFP